MHVEPIEQVAPEVPGVDRRLQVDVGRGDEPHVDAAALVLADAAHLAGLERAEQLRLQRRSASSPISSRNSVPPDGVLDQPGRAPPAAPVNAPRAWPNSSFSSSDSVSAAQFSATNGFAARGLLA